jgi:hypothetical protein
MGEVFFEFITFANFGNLDNLQPGWGPTCQWVIFLLTAWPNYPYLPCLPCGQFPPVIAPPRGECHYTGRRRSPQPHGGWCLSSACGHPERSPLPLLFHASDSRPSALLTSALLCFPPCRSSVHRQLPPAAATTEHHRRR